MLTREQIEQIGGALRRRKPASALRLLILHHVAEGQKARAAMLAAEGAARYVHQAVAFEHKVIAHDLCILLIEADVAVWERLGPDLQAAVDGLDDSLPPAPGAGPNDDSAAP